MSVETGSSTEAGIQWGQSLAGAATVQGETARRRGLLREDVRGPAACLRRDSLFRRSLLAADVVAILAALVLTVVLSSRRVPLHLTWESIAGVPLLLIAAKLLGLYDRDETLLRKTTLDEAPKLFELATLCTLVAWLGGRLVVAGSLDRREAFFLWVALSVFLIAGRAVARVIALRLGPSERCLFIGDERSARIVGSKLSGHSGIKARIIAHLDMDQVAPWSTDAFSAPRLAEIRDLARTLDVHRAIIAPGWGADADAGETLNLVRTLKAVGVRVSVLPRMLEVVGSSVEFDDLHGVTLMGVRRFELSRSSGWIKRSFDVLGATLGLLAIAPVMLRSGAGDQARQPRPRSSSASCASGATAGASTCSSSARW